MPGSVTVALPSAPMTALCVPGLAPLIAETSRLPVNGLSAVSLAVTVNVIGTPCGAPALVWSNCSAAGSAVRTSSSKDAVAPAASVWAGSRYWSHSTAPALSTGSPRTVSSNDGVAASPAFSTRDQMSLPSVSEGSL